MINQKKCTNLVLFLIVLLTILECNSLYVYLVGARYITSAASNLYIHPIPQEIKMAHTKCTNTRNTLFQ